MRSEKYYGKIDISYRILYTTAVREPNKKRYCFSQKPPYICIALSTTSLGAAEAHATDKLLVGVEQKQKYI